MVPAGYLYKHVYTWPEGCAIGCSRDVYSLSTCISKDFADYTNFWKHNGYWLFNSPKEMDDLAAAKQIDLAGTDLFYYEVYKNEFYEECEEWWAFEPVSNFTTDVQVPTNKRLEGYDVCTFSGYCAPDCSPLSCNYLAARIDVNVHCLIKTLKAAKNALEVGKFKNSEPGPFRIFAVYSVNANNQYSTTARLVPK